MMFFSVVVEDDGCDDDEKCLKHLLTLFCVRFVFMYDVEYL